MSNNLLVENPTTLRHTRTDAEREVFADNTLAALRLHRRQANLDALGIYSRQAAQKIESPDTPNLLKALLYIETAHAAHVLGKAHHARDLLLRAESVLPFGAGEAVSSIRRLHSRLHLDARDLQAALVVASEVDALVLERGKDAAAIVDRHESNISTQTWVLLTELALVQHDFEAARTCLAKGTLEHATDEARYTKIRGYLLTPAERRFYNDQFRDTHAMFRLLEAVYQIASGHASGYQLLIELEHQLLSQESPNLQIIARLRAANNTWNPASSIPPHGINLAEALRWHAITTSTTPPLTSEVEVSTTTELAVCASSVPFTNHARPTATSDSVVTQLAAALLQVIGKIPLASPDEERGSFGGVFTTFDLFSQILAATHKQFTGVIEVKWNPAKIETSIMANRIDARARAGVGWVFLSGGAIIDAMVGAENPPREVAKSEDHAREMLLILLQIGLSLGLIEIPDGYGTAIKNAGVQFRHPRISTTATESLLYQLITDREKELGMMHDDDDEATFSGE